jgi:hypothetical protein
VAHGAALFYGGGNHFKKLSYLKYVIRVVGCFNGFVG